MQFAQNLLEFRERVRAFALGIKERQGKLVVYGSSVGGLMMVYHLGMSDLIDCFVDDNSLYFVLFKDGIFYRTKILMEHVFFSVFEDNDFGLKVGQLFSKKLEQEQFGDDNVSKDSE